MAFDSEFGKVCPLNSNFPVLLAPMVGLTHVATRRMIRRYLPANAETLWPTEMLNSWRLEKETLGETPETLKHSSERNLCPQILGNEEEAIRVAVQKLTDWGAVAVDINMGCPVRKALKHNYGVALMGDSDYAADVVRMTVKHAKIPISVKLRAGHQRDEDYLLRFTRGLQDAGASWITLHPRLAQEKRRGRADWSQIGFLTRNLKIPVVGNGDVQTAEDVFSLMEQTSCRAVMIGRALTARPWILWQVGHRLGLENPTGLTGVPPQTPIEEGAEYGRALLYFLDCLDEHFSEEQAIKRLKFMLRMNHVWLEFGHALWSKMTGVKSLNEARDVTLQFFSQPQKMTVKTDLRE